MNVLHLATLLAFAIAPQAGQDVDVAIVFAVDLSTSVDTAELELFVEGHASAIEAPEVVRAIRNGRIGCIAISYFEWSSVGEQREVLPWTRICDQQAASAASVVVRQRGTKMIGRAARRGATSISFALTWSAFLLDGFTGQAERKLIDLSAEGPNNDGAPVAEVREAVLEKGYVINAIALALDQKDPETAALPDYLGTRVIGGDGSFMLAAAEPSSFARVLRRKLLLEIGMAEASVDGLPAPAGAGRASGEGCRTSGHPCR